MWRRQRQLPVAEPFRFGIEGADANAPSQQRRLRDYLFSTNCFNFGAFSDPLPKSFTTRDAAVAIVPVVRLTPAAPKTRGAFWYNRTVNVGEGFLTTFTIQISSVGRAKVADGMAFVMQTDGPTSIGTDGKGMGYEGLHGVAIEFDTFCNAASCADPNNNHISVQVPMNQPTLLPTHHTSVASTGSTLPLLADGRPHRFTVAYTPPGFPSACEGEPAAAMAGFLDIWMDDQHVLSKRDFNLSQWLPNHAFVGFTAGTGGLYACHDVCTWEMRTGIRWEPEMHHLFQPTTQDMIRALLFVRTCAAPIDRRLNESAMADINDHWATLPIEVCFEVFRIAVAQAGDW